MIPVPPWAYAAAAGVLAIGGFTVGWQVRTWRCDAAVAEALREAAKLKDENQKLVEKLATAYEAEHQAAEIEGRTNEVQIRTFYRDRPVPADCAVPDDVRGMLEGGVHRANTRATGQSGG